MKKVIDKDLKETIYYCSHKIICRQWKCNGQYDFIIVDKFDDTKRMGSSYRHYSDAINHLMDKGMLNTRTFYPVYESKFIK